MNTSSGGNDSGLKTLLLKHSFIELVDFYARGFKMLFRPSKLLSSGELAATSSARGIRLRKCIACLLPIPPRRARPTLSLGGGIANDLESIKCRKVTVNPDQSNCQPRNIEVPGKGFSR